VCAHGFEHDPERSAIVQRFARQVLDRDQIIREDTPEASSDPADGEIQNLVAIPLYLRGRFDGVIVCANRRDGFEDVDDDLLLALGDHAGAALQSERLERDLQDSYRAVVRMLVGVLDARDPVLRREAGESTLLARAVARRLDLSSHELEVIATAALLRDVGNVVIPERILLTPGPLSPGISQQEYSRLFVQNRVGVVSDEGPRGIEEGADVVVGSPAELLELLRTL